MAVIPKKIGWIFLILSIILPACQSLGQPAPELKKQNVSSSFSPIDINHFLHRFDPHFFATSQTVAQKHRLNIGETGYIVKRKHNILLKITLNDVQFLNYFHGIRDHLFKRFPKGKYILANFTVTNLSEVPLTAGQFKYPVITSKNALKKIKKDTFSRQDQFGAGLPLFMFDSSIQSKTIIGSQTITADLLLYTKKQADEFLIYFTDQDYLNELTFEVPYIYDAFKQTFFSY